MNRPQRSQLSPALGPGRSRMLQASGAVVVAASVGVGLPLFGLRPYALVPLLVGALAVAIGGAFAKRETSTSSLRHLAKWAVPVVVVAACWALAHFAIVRIDVTQEQVNSLSDESRAIARSLTDGGAHVRVVSFAAAGDRAETELVALVERYQGEAPGLVLERRSMKSAADAAVAGRLGVAELLPLGGPNVVVVVSDKEDVVGSDGERVGARLRFDGGAPNQEEQLTNALREATTTAARARVYVVAGHGEPDVRDEGAGGLARLKRDLLARNIDLTPLPLPLLHQVPDDARAVLVFPTTAPLSEQERKLLDEFVARHGAVFAFAEPAGSSIVEDVVHLAAGFGVTVLDDVLVDESPFSGMLGADTITGGSQMAHPISQPLRGALTHFPRAAPLAVSPIDGIVVVPVVSTGAEAKAPKVNAQGPLPLVVACDGQQKIAGRAVVAADASFVENAGLGLGANRDLALNAILWLVKDESWIAVRPRAKTGALLFLTPSSREALAFVLMFLIPVTLAALGAARAASRR